MAKACSTCNADLPSSYPYKYCQECRNEFGRYMRDGHYHTELDRGFPSKGRDRITERLRAGFALMNDEDTED